MTSKVEYPEQTDTTDPDVLVLNSDYICQGLFVLRCAVGGFVSIFLPVFYSGMGLTDFEIGVITTASPICSIIGNPLWGGVADQRVGIRKNLMILLACLSLCTLICLIPIAFFIPKRFRFPCILVDQCLGSFFVMSGLLDGLVVEQTSKNAYGRKRLWCAIGYGLASGVAGLAMYFVNSQDRYTPYMAHFTPAVACALISIGLLLLLENTEYRKMKVPTLSLQKESEEETLLVPKEEIAQQSFCTKLGRLPLTSGFLLFIVVIFICGAHMGLVSTYLFLFIQNELPNGTQLVMGVSVLVTCSFEVPVFYYSNLLLDRLSPDLSLLISLFAYILRFGTYWLFAVIKPNAWWILFPEVLHGFTFALMWCCAVAKASDMFEGLGLNNFAMSLMGSILTFGNAVGALTVGALLSHGMSYAHLWMGTTYILGATTVLWVIKSILEHYGSEAKEINK